ncbi:MAG TPA: cobalamin B12-binding domain-containing protein [Gemmatimonadales bacterium]|nr:cobalamin B12-binding domain-containing protein [Gemmatimonadales bacterium]
MPDSRPGGSSTTRSLTGSAPAFRDAHPVLPRTLPAGYQAAAALPPFGVEPIRELMARLRKPTADVEHFVRDLIAGGASPDQLMMELFAPTARQLGRMWETDECSFVEVTVAVARLQQLVHVASEALRLSPGPRPALGRALVAWVPGEQHSLGLTMVAEYLRRDGWELVVAPAHTDARGLVSLAAQEWFDVVALSAAGDRQIVKLRRLVNDLRRAGRNRDVRVMVGGSLFEDRKDLVQRVGADGWAPDAPGAARLAAELL